MSSENNCILDVCRVCLEKSTKLYPLLGQIPNVDENISNMIKYCTLIEVTVEDGLPGGVCVTCFRTVRIAYNFIRLFKETNTKLFENRNKDNQHVYNAQEDSLCIKRNLGEEYNIENVEEIIIECREDFDYNMCSENVKIEENCDEIEIHSGNFSEEEKLVQYSESNVENSIIEKQDEVECENVPVNNNELSKELKEPSLLLESKNVPNFICPVCEQCFSKFEVGFVKHLLTHGDAKLQCDKCSLQTSLTMDLYVEHFRKEHRFQCNICAKSYGRRSGLYYHMKTHDKKIYKCSYINCSKSFIAAWCLRKHLHTHSEFSKYVCSKCGTTFKTSETYRYHQKTHDGNRNYLCTECGQTFLQSIHLKYHMWRHSGIKMFKCDNCPKSYTSQTQLKKHKKRKICGITHNH